MPTTQNRRLDRIASRSVAVIGAAGALWAAMTTGAAAQVDRYMTIQPIQVCNDAGANCAPVTTFIAETTKIYEQAGVLPVFLPTTQLNSTNLLTNATGVANLDVAGNGQHPNSTTINVWYVRDLVEAAGTLFGEAWINANGVVVDGLAVQNFNGGNGRRDTTAHEIGHNLNLGHSNFGAGGADNLMTAGSSRSVPGGVADINPDGAMLSMLTMAQITELRTSPFVIEVPDVTVDTNGSTPFNTDDFFQVDFNSGSGSLTKLTMNVAPVGAFVDSVSDGPLFVYPGGDGSPFMFDNLVGLDAGDIMLISSVDGGSIVEIGFTPGAFTAGDSFDFGIDIDLFTNVDGFGATPAELIGTLFTFEFEDGFAGQAEIEADLIASSNRLTGGGFVGEPSGGPVLPPGRVTDDPDPVVEPSSLVALVTGMLGLFGGLGLRRRSC